MRLPRRVAVVVLAVIIGLSLALTSCGGGGSTNITTPPPADPPVPPGIISGSVSVTGVAPTSVTVTWQTDQSSTSQVEYGLSTTYGSSTPLDNSAVTAHTVKITGLDPATTYHFRVRSGNANGSIVSFDSTFTTSIKPANDVQAEPRTIALVVSPEVSAADTQGVLFQLASAIESDYRAIASAKDAVVSTKVIASAGDANTVRNLLRSVDHLWGAILIGNVASPWIIEGQLVVSATYAQPITNGLSTNPSAPGLPAAVEIYRQQPLLRPTDLERIASTPHGRNVRYDFHLQPASAADTSSASDAHPSNASPFDMPYKVPNCSYYQIASDNRVTVDSWNTPPTPECTRTVWISRITGTNEQILSFVQRDLNSRHQPAPLQKYAYMRADWQGGLAYPDLLRYWANNALYDSSDVNYVTTYTPADTAASRFDEWKTWLTSGTEMATISIHGAPQLVQFEGQGTAGTLYSNDSITVTASDLAALPNHSRVLDLRSCSTGNYFFPDFFAGVALFAGDALLVNASTVTIAASEEQWEQYQVRKKYHMLANGATFADIDMSPEAPLILFGDPTISLRPRPSASGRPVLSVSTDGINFYRFHGPWAALDVPFAAKSVGDTKVIQPVTLRNDGDANLAVQLTIMPDKVGIDGAAPACFKPGMGCSGMGFGIDSPNALTESGIGDIGNVTFTIAPGQKLEVNYFMLPMAIGYFDGTLGPKLYGNYSARFQIFTVDAADHSTGYSDPSLGRLDLYVSGTVAP